MGKNEILVGQALLLLLNKYKNDINKYQRFRDYYLLGANNIAALSEIEYDIKLINQDYSLSFDVHKISEDPTRRYFETHLTYHTLAEKLQFIDKNHLIDLRNAMLKNLFAHEKRFKFDHADHNAYQYFYSIFSYLSDMNFIHLTINTDIFHLRQSLLQYLYTLFCYPIYEHRKLAMVLQAKAHQALRKAISSIRQIQAAGMNISPALCKKFLMNAIAPLKKICTLYQDIFPTTVFETQRPKQYLISYSNTFSFKTDQSLSEIMLNIHGAFISLFTTKFSSKERRKIILILQIAALSTMLGWSNQESHWLSPNVDLLDIILCNERFRGRIFKYKHETETSQLIQLTPITAKKLLVPTSQNLGILKSYTAIPLDNIAYNPQLVNVMRASDKFDFKPQAKWPKINFEHCVHPYVSSISGSLNLFLRVLFTLKEHHFKIFSSVENTFTFYQAYFSSLIFFIGGHSLNEYFHVHQGLSQLDKNAMQFITGFSNLTLSSVILNGLTGVENHFTHNGKAVDTAINSTIEYHGHMIKRNELHKELLFFMPEHPDNAADLQMTQQQALTRNI